MVKANTVLLVLSIILLVIAIAGVVFSWILYYRMMTFVEKNQYWDYILASSILTGISLVGLLIIGIGKSIVGSRQATPVKPPSPTQIKVMMAQAQKATQGTGQVQGPSGSSTSDWIARSIYIFILLMLGTSIGLSSYVIISHYRNQTS